MTPALTTTTALRIDSDIPILVAHVAYANGAGRDAFPVPPAASELWGIRTQHTLIAARETNTSIAVYTSNGSSANYLLNAGEQIAVNVGLATANGQGNAVHIVASAPISAIQHDDGDGNDATASWSGAVFGRRHGLPLDSQYLAVTCKDASVTLTLYKGPNAPEVQTCSANGNFPGKAYFGSADSGPHLSAGWYLVSSSPVYAIYEASATDDEHNVQGWDPIPGPASPVLNSVSSPTYNNPQAVTGTAQANQTVRLYINGLLQATTVADSSGDYSFSAALIDGSNAIYTAAVENNNESDPSNAITVEYINSISRNQGGTVSGHVVWTPGNPAQPYVISAHLTIAAGATLTLQPGTTLKFNSGRKLTATGQLIVSGTAAEPVVLTSSAASPTRGSWEGVVIDGSASSTINHARIEYASIGVTLSSVPGSVRNSTITRFSSYGIWVTGQGSSTSLIEGNTIDNENKSGSCLWSQHSSPQVKRNVFTRCSNGLYVTMDGAPVVTDDNLIVSNTMGVHLFGNSSYVPQPVVTGNRIYSNSNKNVHTNGFPAGSATVKLNFNGNWWGSSDAAAIAASIQDRSDSDVLPTVDFSGYLSAAYGSAVPGNQLIGYLTATTTTLVAGGTYDLLGLVVVPAGKALVIPAGTTLRSYAPTTALLVEGELEIEGLVGQPSVLTSGRVTKARGDWKGIEVVAGGAAAIENAVVEYVASGVTVLNASGSVRNSLIRNFASYGIYFQGANAVGTAEGNTIDNENKTGSCIWTQAASPQIQDNILTRCANGVYATMNASPVVSGNTITANDRGVHLFGNNSYLPQPIVTGNQIFSNTGYNYYTLSFGPGATNLRLNATGNWWGSTDPATIASKIADLTDNYASSTLPIVDFSNFLDSLSGNPVAGNHLIGPFAAGSTVLSAGATYDILSSVIVPTNGSLTIPAGTTLRFHSSGLSVKGSLVVEGTSSAPVTFTSGQASPTRGGWAAIDIPSGSGSVVIDHAHVEWASYGVIIRNSNAIVRDTTIQNFANSGIFVESSAGSSIQLLGNTVNNLNDTGNCIEVYNSSPLIQGNSLSNCNRGIHAYYTSSPSVTGNIITSNKKGIEVSGGNGQNPLPVITENHIFGNHDYSIQASAFTTSGSTLTLNARNNWWGSTDPVVIAASIYDLMDALTDTRRPTIDFAHFLDSANGTPAVGNFLIGAFASSSTTLAANTTYDVLGSVIVVSGRTLTIEPGVTLRMHGSTTRLVVDGQLAVEGTGSAPVTFTSGLANPTRGSWEMIEVRASGGPALIEHAVVEFAKYAVVFRAPNAVLRDSSIRDFTNTAIYIDSTATANVQVIDNLVDNTNDTGNCVYILRTSPLIEGNRLENCENGIWLDTSGSPAVMGNAITGNKYGLKVIGRTTGNPTPVANSNGIFANTTYNYYAGEYSTGGSNIVLNAHNNWWGSNDPVQIAAMISDLMDSIGDSRRPTVDFSGYLDGENGTATPGSFLIGPITESISLAADTTYNVLGPVIIRSGRTLTLPAGSVLRFPGTQTKIVVDGSLNIQGTPTSRVRLESTSSPSTKGAWYGVEVRSSAATVTIDHAVIDGAVRGVMVTNSNITLTNTIITNFSDAGVYLSGSGASTMIASNTIDNGNDVGYGIYLLAASPQITLNGIYNTAVAIYAVGVSNATITSNEIADNLRGIVLDGNGSNNANSVPTPVITGNDIDSNPNGGLEGYRYGVSNSAVINATGNWWGVSAPQIGQQIRFTNGSPASVLNYSNAASSPVSTLDGRSPTIPGSLIVRRVGPGIFLEWSLSADNTGVTAYIIERCEGIGCTNFEPIATLSGNAYENAALTAGTTYRYRVRAQDAASNLSGYSSIASSSTRSATEVNCD